MRKNNGVLNLIIAIVLFFGYCATMICMGYANSECTYQSPHQRYMYGVLDGILVLVLFCAIGGLIFSLIYEDDKPTDKGIFSQKDMD